MNDESTSAPRPGSDPPVDFRGHLATIRLRRCPILLAATAVALLVFLVRLLTPPTYAADVTARVDAPSGSQTQPADAATFAAQTAVGLAGTPEVRAAAADGSGLGVDAAEVATRVRVSQAEAPGFLTIRATGPTPREATVLADATAAALTARLADDRTAAARAATAPLRAQLTGLDEQLARLGPQAPERAATEQQVSALVDAITSVEAAPAPSLRAGPAVPAPRPVSPTPLRDALLALVVALIVIAEGVVLVRAARGRLSEAEPAAQVTAAVGLPAAEADRGPDPATALAPLYRAHLRRTDAVGGPLVSVQLGDPRSRDLARDLAGAAALAGDRVGVHDRGAAGRVGAPAVVRLRGRRLDAELLTRVRDAGGPVVLAVDTASTGRRQLEHDVLALRAVGARVAAVVVWRGRPPREERAERAAAAASDAGAGVPTHAAPAGVPSGARSGDR